MPRTDFYNINEHRDYPLIPQTDPPTRLVASLGSASLGDIADIPHSLLVDAGFIFGVLVPFNPAADYAWVSRIARTTSAVHITLETNATSQKLSFTVATDTAAYSRHWATSGASPGEASSDSSVSSASASSASATGEAVEIDSCEEPDWEGFIVIGTLDVLLDTLAVGDTRDLTPGQWLVEPAKLQTLCNQYVNSINLANTRRTVVTNACDSASATSDAAIAETVCIQGDIEVKAGYNCNIRQVTDTRTLEIHGAIGGGEGQPCEEVPRYPGEAAPDGSPFLSGGPGCSELVRTINGVGGKRVQLEAGPGFRIAASDTEPHTLVIRADMSDFALCVAEPGFAGDPCDPVSASSSAGVV